MYIPYYVYYCDPTETVAAVTVTAVTEKGIDLCEIEAYGEWLYIFEIE